MIFIYHEPPPPAPTPHLTHTQTNTKPCFYCSEWFSALIYLANLSLFWEVFSNRPRKNPTLSTLFPKQLENVLIESLHCLGIVYTPVFPPRDWDDLRARLTARLCRSAQCQASRKSPVIAVGLQVWENQHGAVLLSSTWPGWLLTDVQFFQGHLLPD